MFVVEAEEEEGLVFTTCKQRWRSAYPACELETFRANASRSHETKSSRSIDRPGLQADFVTICDPLTGRIGEGWGGHTSCQEISGVPGLDLQWLIPALTSVTNTPPENMDEIIAEEGH